MNENGGRPMNDLMKYISFTKNETKVILFIVTVLVAGFSIKYYKQVINNDLNTPYDYTGSDAEFKRLSDNIAKGSSPKGYIDSLNKSGPDLTHKLKNSGDSILAGSNLSGREKTVKIPENIININTATKEELIGLPGVGEFTADKIILYRIDKGFRKTEDLMKVNGIGKKKYEKIKSYIKTE
ncbi:MAG: helix-hairpin-helix domain-containing protein [Bacteroidota bacterium]|nr:helix-hairpin-helix domain-containing protein [Bacteroidota bacterium]